MSAVWSHCEMMVPVSVVTGNISIPGNAQLCLLFLDNKPMMNIGDAFLLLHWT